jgi:hypothetical protein
MAKSKKPQDDGLVPQVVMNQLVEHTAGGFVLFYFNSIDGAPEQYLTFDSPAHCLALQKHIADWSYALQDLNVESEKRHIEKACQAEAEPPEEEDDVI